VQIEAPQNYVDSTAAAEAEASTARRTMMAAERKDADDGTRSIRLGRDRIQSVT
jgi:hypothetical protein